MHFLSSQMTLNFEKKVIFKLRESCEHSLQHIQFNQKHPRYNKGTAKN